MIQQGVSIKDAEVLDDEQQYTSLEDHKLKKDKKAFMIQDEDAVRKAVANAALKYNIKMHKDEEILKANQRIAERSRRCDELRQSMHEMDELVDVTEKCTAISPSKTNTYIDQEGNLRRRVSVSPEDGYTPGPETPPAPTSTKVDEPRQYC
ncbi:hypothetical protein DVH05_014686 [Phytophthora capsici]|nr:hypothetical protein DVH05_014686 [Phytophthora capsici]